MRIQGGNNPKYQVIVDQNEEIHLQQGEAEISVEQQQTLTVEQTEALVDQLTDMLLNMSPQQGASLTENLPEWLKQVIFNRLQEQQHQDNQPDNT